MCLRGSNKCDKLLQSLQALTNFETTTIANRLKLIIGLRFILYTSYSVFLIMLSGDVEIHPGPRCKEKDSVKCVTINTRSLTSLVKFNNSNKTETNLERFPNFVYSEDFDIVCINETLLSANVYNAEILHSGYTIIRNDSKTRGGGVLLGVKTSTFKSVREIEYKQELEVALAEITTTSNIKMLVCSCYRPPDAEKSWMNEYESFLQDVCTRHSKIVIAGDFNLPRTCRQSNENGFGGNEHASVKILNDFFLEQIITSPTRGENILDLVITSIPDRMKVSEVVKPSDTEISTDHSAIVFNLSLSCNSIPKIKRTVFDYRRADFDGLRSHIHSLNLAGRSR